MLKKFIVVISFIQLFSCSSVPIVENSNFSKNIIHKKKFTLSTYSYFDKILQNKLSENDVWDLLTSKFKNKYFYNSQDLFLDNYNIFLDVLHSSFNKTNIDIQNQFPSVIVYYNLGKSYTILKYANKKWKIDEIKSKKFSDFLILNNYFDKSEGKNITGINILDPLSLYIKTDKNLPVILELFDDVLNKKFIDYNKDIRFRKNLINCANLFIERYLKEYAKTNETEYLKKGIEFADKIEKKNLTNSYFYFLRGSIYYQLEFFKRSVDNFEKCLFRYNTYSNKDIYIKSLYKIVKAHILLGEKNSLRKKINFYYKKFDKIKILTQCIKKIMQHKNELFSYKGTDIKKINLIEKLIYFEEYDKSLWECESFINEYKDSFFMFENIIQLSRSYYYKYNNTFEKKYIDKLNSIKETLLKDNKNCYVLKEFLLIYADVYSREYLNKDEFQKGIDYIEKNIEKIKDMHTKELLYYYLGKAYCLKKEWKKSIKIFNQILQDNEYDNISYKINPSNLTKKLLENHKTLNYLSYPFLDYIGVSKNVFNELNFIKLNKRNKINPIKEKIILINSIPVIDYYSFYKVIYGLKIGEMATVLFKRNEYEYDKYIRIKDFI